MKKIWLNILGAGFCVNALAMLFATETWYQLTPGVDDTGPLNFHFIRDIGCAYLAAGIGVLWAQRNPAAWPAAFAGGLFLAFHALLHVFDTLMGRVTLPHLASDAFLVMLPAVLVLRLSWPRKESA